MDEGHYIDQERRLRDRMQFTSPFAKPEQPDPWAATVTPEPSSQQLQLAQLIELLQQRMKQQPEPYPDLTGSAD